MKGNAPFLLLRARPNPDHEGEFDRWFGELHLRDVRRIPGIVQVLQGRTPGGTRLGVYSFENSEGLQASLSSPEAAYARGTWSQWTDRLDELSLEIFAPLFPMSIYESIS